MFALRCTNAALARLSSLPTERDDFADLLAWVWAMIPPAQHDAHPSPESLAIIVGNARAAYLRAVSDAIAAAQQPDELAVWFLAELGVSRDAFDAMTPADTAAATRAWKARQEREERRTARLCWAAFAAAGKRTDGTPWRVDDFMEQPPLTEEQQTAYTAAQFAVMAGAIKSREKQQEREAEERRG
jgi:hypothetical protein